MQTAKVGMKELDRHLGEILAIAQREPVLVLRRNAPWLCIVPDMIWEHPNPWASMIPADHPVHRLRDHVDARLSPVLLTQAARHIESGISADIVLRILVLKQVYGIHNDGYLREQLTYDMLCRWFAGLPQECDRVDDAVAAVCALGGLADLDALTRELLDGAPLDAFAPLARQRNGGAMACN